MSQTNQFNFSELDQINLIGSSNGCTVYQVRHPSIARFYALKVITIDPEEEFARRQILHEMELLRDLNHPNIVKCHNILDRNGEDIQVLLEFVDGGSLAGRHITSEGHLSNIGRQILSGIAYIRGRKVAHLNIKPSNLLIGDPLDKVKIADFGAGKILSQTLNPEDFVGTIKYMSPERIDGGLYDGYAGDIWSFGLSILEIYLGRFPIEVERQDYLTRLVFAVCMSAPPEAPSSASMEFRHFIICCFQREPERRWSALQLLQHPFILQNQVNQ